MKRTLAERAAEVKLTMMRGWLKATSGHGWHTIKFSKADGIAYCTCPAWKYSHEAPKHRWCKHLEAAHLKGLLKKLADQGCA